MPALTLGELIERWEARLERSTGCWLWPGATSGGGYGHVRVPAPDGGRRDVPLHRVLYEHHVGPVPVNHDLDHLCRTRRCVNPSHLEPVSRAENLKRGRGVGGIRAGSPPALNAAKTHCPKGHVYDEANTYIHPPTGRRSCRACDRQRYQELREAA